MYRGRVCLKGASAKGGSKRKEGMSFSKARGSKSNGNHTWIVITDAKILERLVVQIEQ